MIPIKLTNFRLEKLYLDCIDIHGNCFIIYLAKLEFWFIKIIYSGLIFSDLNGVTIEKSVFKKIPEPLRNEHLHFNNPLLQIRGNWESTDNSISLVLFKDAMNNELFWNCHHPKALTEIVYKETSYKGYGYAETVFLTIKPWKLPIKELRWGRFLSENYTITWIHWNGNYPVNKIFCNGAEYNDAVFKEDRIVFDSGFFTLMFQEISIIRKGKLSNTLSGMPWLKIIFNNRILNTNEIKYKAESSLKKNSKITATGWALFEIVTWAN